MYNDLMINTYLDESDSDFSEHESVSSDKIKFYEQKYTQMFKLDGQARAKMEEQQTKREKLDQLLYRGT
mgnify:FL=1